MRSCGVAICFLLCLPAAVGQTATPSAQAAAASEAAKPLPKVEDLIAHAQARQATAEELRKSYFYKETVVADEFDSHGNKKGTHTDEFQTWTVTHTNGSTVQYVTVSQHVAHDGKPLSPEDARKEQERVDKEVASVKDGSYKGRNGGVVLSVSHLLKMCSFTNERREDINGRPTIHFDYTGNASAKASDMGEEIMKKLTGELWVDEEDAAIVKLTGKLNENFHVAGGLLVNVKAGSWFSMETAHINSEIWFIHRLQAHADGRFLLFKGFDGNADMTFSDYRKMKTSVTLLPGSRVVGEDGKPIPEDAEPAGLPAKPQ